MRILKLVAILPILLVASMFASAEIVLRASSGVFALIRMRLFRGYEYKRWLARDLADCETILELGCGSNSPILQIGYGGKTYAVDIWPAYITKHRKVKSYLRCWQQDIMKMRLPEGGYDAVVMCDVLEHLPRPEVLAGGLMDRMEACAKKKVIMFTPNGYVDNDEVDGDPYQAHISAWEPSDYLVRGYKVRGATGLRYLYGKASLPKYRPYTSCAIIGMLTKPLVFLFPKLAWHSYAVKEL